ncbi:MFS transporter [Roseomonas sp. GC11]|uniref:MFS transporter n=1 Tax=Roseomonas sp. GC11 TaxID=2950546 RepID=UPI002108FF0C|nr:MFS transporter [Roseomonas sp. GC11]MCQ4159472.1 MFS transporter [Roseomonas sp. GC11]
MEVGRHLEIQGFVDTRPFSALQKLVFVLCFCIVLLDGFDTAMIGFVAPSLVKEWGIARPALAPVLSAALFGLACGALLSGPVADRIGRRMILILAVGIFGLASLLSAWSGTIEHLVLWRFITGVGLGAAMPNAATLMSEYAPRPRRAFIVNSMFCGFPLGSALGGFLAAWMIPQWGWRSVFVLGGVAPLALVLVMIAALPESIRYMVLKQKPAEAIRAILGRIGPEARQATRFVLAEAGPAASGGIRLVLSRRYALGSVSLWLAYFMGLVIIYALVNWMPVLFGDAGMQPATAAMVAALFQLGGIGAIFVGWLMDRFNPNRIVAAGFALAAAAVAVVGMVTGHLTLLVCAVFSAGTLVNAAQSSLPALAAEFYPTEGRATGVSWMLGLGRFGGIAGSFLVAELARAQMSLTGIFWVVAIPGLIAGSALLAKQFFYPAGGAPAAPRQVAATGS